MLQVQGAGWSGMHEQMPCIQTFASEAGKALAPRDGCSVFVGSQRGQRHVAGATKPTDKPVCASQRIVRANAERWSSLRNMPGVFL